MGYCEQHRALAHPSSPPAKTRTHLVQRGADLLHVERHKLVDRALALPLRPVGRKELDGGLQRWQSGGKWRGQGLLLANTKTAAVQNAVEHART